MTTVEVSVGEMVVFGGQRHVVAWGPGSEYGSSGTSMIFLLQNQGRLLAFGTAGMKSGSSRTPRWIPVPIPHTSLQLVWRQCLTRTWRGPSSRFRSA